MYMPSAAVALPGGLSCATYTPILCSSIWPTKQRSLARFLLGWADIIHQKGARRLFYVSKRPLDFFFFVLLKSQEHSALFVVVFSSCLIQSCWIKNAKEWTFKINVKNTVFWKISIIQGCTWVITVAFVYRLNYHYDPSSFTVDDFWKYVIQHINCAWYNLFFLSWEIFWSHYQPPENLR